MWVFVISRKITGAFTVEQELNALNADFPKNVFKHVGKTRALVMVPVDGDPLIEEIQLLADNPRLVPGGASLAWFQEDLREDILRTIEENEVKKKSTDDLKEEAMSGFADLLDGMGTLRGFARRLPEDLKQQMRDHAKKCTDPDCGVSRILGEEDKGEKADVAPTGGGPFHVGDIVRVRKWEGRVEGLLWRDENGLGMESLLDKDLIISSIQTGDEPGKFVADFEGVLPYVIPTSQLDLVRRPSSEPAPAAAPDAFFAPGDTVYVREWEGYCPRDEYFEMSFEPDMKAAIGSPQKVQCVTGGAVELEGFPKRGWPFVHVSKTPWTTEPTNTPTTPDSPQQP